MWNTLSDASGTAEIILRLRLLLGSVEVGPLGVICCNRARITRDRDLDDSLYLERAVPAFGV